MGLKKLLFTVTVATVGGVDAVAVPKAQPRGVPGSREASTAAGGTGRSGRCPEHVNSTIARPRSGGTLTHLDLRAWSVRVTPRMRRGRVSAAEARPTPSPFCLSQVRAQR